MNEAHVIENLATMKYIEVVSLVEKLTPCASTTTSTNNSFAMTKVNVLIVPIPASSHDMAFSLTRPDDEGGGGMIHSVLLVQDDQFVTNDVGGLVEAQYRIII